MCKIIVRKLKERKILFRPCIQSSCMKPEIGSLRLWRGQPEPKEFVAFFLFLESLLIFISNGLLKPRSTGKRGIVFFQNLRYEVS